jgi:general secretion pathway protein K
MQGRFNINNLAGNQSLNEFIRLLQIANPELSQEKAMAILQSIIVWISQGAPSRDANNYYFARPQPYRNAGRKMLTVSELSMVQGITPALYAALAPNLSALPEDTKINVQTATMPVLMSLSPSITPEIAQQIIEVRQAQPFISIDVFMNLDVIKNNHITTDAITINSSYFLVKTEVKIENQQLVIYTLLCRAIKDNKANVVIVWQSKGTL